MSTVNIKSRDSSTIIAEGRSLCSTNDGKLSFEEEEEVLHVGPPSLEPTIASQLMTPAKRLMPNCLKGNSGMILQNLHAVANRRTVEPDKRSPSVRDVGSIIMNDNTVTRRKIHVSMCQDTGVITEKGSGQSSHWEVLTLAPRRRIARLNTMTNQEFHRQLQG